MRNISKQTGYTLVELMIVVGIIGVIAATAIPTYNNYISTTCISTARTNLETLALHLENYNIENTTYLAGIHNSTDSLSNSALMKPLHWDPNDNSEYTYTVTLNSPYDGKLYAYVVSVEGKQACADATTKFGLIQKGFHEQ